MKNEKCLQQGSRRCIATLINVVLWLCFCLFGGVAVHAQDVQAPSAPTGLAATGASSAQINLSWTASTDNVGVTGYLIERCQGAGCSNFSQIATPTTTSYSDTGRTPATSYSYRVRARDAVPNYSAYSNTATAATGAAPAAPTNIQATAVSASEIDLTWSMPGGGAGITAYVIERCQNANCSNFALAGFALGGAAGTQTFFNPGLAAATSYSYRIMSSDGASPSAYSSVFTVVTLATAACD